MIHRARAAQFIGAVLAVAAFAIVGCGGGSSNTTNPGTGGGPTFDFHFPSTGTSNQFTFSAAGTWAYHCTPHGGSGMTAPSWWTPARRSTRPSFRWAPATRSRSRPTR